jgi:hypothetical protein
VYSGLVLRRARSQDTYAPVAEDWIFHVVLPAVSYAAILVAAVLLARDVEGPESMIAGATLLMVCVGIHNAWDTVTYLTVNALQAVDHQHEPAPPRRNDSAKRRGRRR